MTEVLIAGGGIAGCAAALALDRAGAHAVVHEAHPTSTEDLGAFVILASAGVQVLAELGVLDAVDDEALPVRGMAVQSPDGERTFVSRPLAAEGAAGYRLFRRGRLCRILQDCVTERGIELRRGARPVDVRGEPGAVQVTDAGGERSRADLVVAADGLRSGLRGLINPAAAAAPRYVGQRVFWGFTPRTDLGSAGTMHVVSTPAVAFAYIPTTRGTYWYARRTAPELSRAELDEPDFARLLTGSLTGVGREVADTATEMLVANSYDLPWVQRWSGRGMLLIGDASHAAAPATGQGGSLALEDGLVLGKAVRDHSGLPAALAAFEAARRDRVQANIVASARASVGETALADAPQGRPLEPAEAARQVCWDAPLTG